MAAVVAAGAASPAAPRSARGGDDRDDHEGASEKTRALGAITDASVISEHLIGRVIIALYMSDRETTKGMTLNGINAWLPSPDIPTAPGESGRHGARERSRVTPHVIAGRAGRAPGPREAGLTSRLIRSRGEGHGRRGNHVADLDNGLRRRRAPSRDLVKRPMLLVALRLAAAAMVLSGCPFFRSATTPMPAVEHSEHGPDKARGLVVFLPGFGDGPDRFTANGFVQRVRGLNQGWDLVAADAHFGYYRSWSIVRRLREDVIEPAKAKGYKEIWLVGISMGGFGAISYAQAYPEEVAGVVIMAAYMGDSDVVGEVVEQGLRQWRPPPDLSAIEDGEERHSYAVWSWLQTYVDGQGDKPKMVVAWGRSDSARRPLGELAKVLPEGQVFTAEGGHKWTTWRGLFATIAPLLLGPRAPGLVQPKRADSLAPGLPHER